MEQLRALLERCEDLVEYYKPYATSQKHQLHGDYTDYMEIVHELLPSKIEWIKEQLQKVGGKRKKRPAAPAKKAAAKPIKPTNKAAAAPVKKAAPAKKQPAK